MNTEVGPPPQVQNYKNIILFGKKKKKDSDCNQIVSDKLQAKQDRIVSKNMQALGIIWPGFKLWLCHLLTRNPREFISSLRAHFLILKNADHNSTYFTRFCEDYKKQNCNCASYRACPLVMNVSSYDVPDIQPASRRNSAQKDFLLHLDHKYLSFI